MPAFILRFRITWLSQLAAVTRVSSEQKRRLAWVRASASRLPLGFFSPRYRAYVWCFFALHSGAALVGAAGSLPFLVEFLPVRRWSSVREFTLYRAAFRPWLCFEKCGGDARDGGRLSLSAGLSPTRCEGTSSSAGRVCRQILALKKRAC